MDAAKVTALELATHTLAHGEGRCRVLPALQLALGKFNREPKTEPKEPEPKNSVPYPVPDIEEPK